MENEFALSRTQLPLAAVLRHAHECPDAPAFIQDDVTLRYREFLQRIRAAAAQLADAGVAAGDRVGLVSGNEIGFPVVVYATAYLGAVIVPVNFRLAGPEIAYILDDCSPRAVVADDARLDVTRQAARDCGAAVFTLSVLSGAGDTTTDQPAPVDAGESSAPPLAVPAADDDAAIMYTSGTTGDPKGAVLTYANLQAVISRITYGWNFQAEKDTPLICTPLFHIAAFDVMIAAISNAACTVLVRSEDVNASRILDLMEEHGVTQTFVVPSLLQILVNEQQRKARELNLRFFAWGAAPASEALLTQASRVLVGADAEAAFGQTETSAIGVSMGHEDSVRKVGAVGRPDRNFSVRVVDTAMQDVAQGEVGEIVYRGPGVMSRYWNKPEATEEVFAGGWFHSGDLVRQDDEGFIYVVDRLKDMIITGGENVYCAELENVLSWHPHVAEVAVIGRPDEKWGEIPVAVIVPSDSANPPTLEDLRTFGEERLARYKLPRDIAVVDAFSRSGTGKVQKTMLRDEDARRNPSR